MLPCTGDENMNAANDKTTEDVEVFPVGRLRQRLGGEESTCVKSGQSVNAMLEALGVEPRSTMVMVSGRRVGKDYVLSPGDKVKLLSLIRGG